LNLISTYTTDLLLAKFNLRINFMDDNLIVVATRKNPLIFRVKGHTEYVAVVGSFHRHGGFGAGFSFGVQNGDARGHCGVENCFSHIP